MHATAHDHPPGAWLAIGALLTPWTLLSLLLPVPHLIAAVSLMMALGLLVACAVRWAQMRAAALGLDAEAWGLAAALSLGYACLLLTGSLERGSGFEALCHDCGRMQDARATFCHGCGSFA